MSGTKSIGPMTGLNVPSLMAQPKSRIDRPRYIGLRVYAYTPEVTSAVVVSGLCGLTVVWARRNSINAAIGAAGAIATTHHPKRFQGSGMMVSTGQE